MNMQQTAREMLEGNIIPFWQGLSDKEFGGYYGYMDIDLKLDKKADKGCILNSRILWFFSEAALVLKRDELLEYASHAYRFLQDCCTDKENGGIFWSVSYDGKPADTTKHTYNQAFAVYALSAYYEASGDKAALDTAFNIFALIEERLKDDTGYGEAFDLSFAPIENDKLSENGIIADKTMNTMLHVFEAYSGLYRASKDKNVAEKMKLILDTYINKIYNPQIKRQDVFFDKDWNNLIDLTSYGHDIESSWLIEWGTKQLGDALEKEIHKRIFDINAALAESVYDRAYRENSVRNECLDEHEDEKRVWWVQAEAVVGFLKMAEKFPEQTKYKEAAENILTFIKEKLVDKRNGSEWLSEVMPDGSNTPERRAIVEQWKCPYHNGRMCLLLTDTHGMVDTKEIKK
ncbi:MAG: AGE family epimerase/isomerase [Oscillospiraceae bacterium]|nr:AGE family epimerase/isomerase [Oscillospiraceae bacterium]